MMRPSLEVEVLDAIRLWRKEGIQLGDRASSLFQETLLAGSPDFSEWEKARSEYSEWRRKSGESLASAIYRVIDGRDE